MKEVITIICLVAIPITVSSICWWLLGQPLRKVLGFLCNDPRPEVKEISGLFWQRLYLSLTMFIPVLFVLFFSPSLHYDLNKILLFAPRWSILCGVILLLVLAYLVRKQIDILQKDVAFFNNNQSEIK
ncbi:MAG: hypothetical protein CR975_02420 [Gammaproteobacteria bacterium]|nr:MAG: hypothetical protein CR975_02420 [Gammaproteobacteria bacterium]